jgi:hypothetical protein
MHPWKDPLKLALNIHPWKTPLLMPTAITSDKTPRKTQQTKLQRYTSGTIRRLWLKPHLLRTAEDLNEIFSMAVSTSLPERKPQPQPTKLGLKQYPWATSTGTNLKI